MPIQPSRRILITGGTGRLGRELVPRCRERGWTVRVMSRRAAAAEERVRGGAVAWSVVRATQFFSLLEAVLAAVARLPVVLGPTDVPGRPVDPRDVAERLADQVASGPSRAIDNYAGPEILTFAELAEQWMDARGRRRPVVHLPIPGRLGRAFRAGRAVPTDGGTGTRTWRAWLEENAPGA